MRVLKKEILKSSIWVWIKHFSKLPYLSKGKSCCVKCNILHIFIYFSSFELWRLTSNIYMVIPKLMHKNCSLYYKRNSIRQQHYFIWGNLGFCCLIIMIFYNFPSTFDLLPRSSSGGVSSTKLYESTCEMKIKVI